jgi:hypothetical protein
MPKVIEYPRSSLKRALELAETVDRLGGECTDQSAAHHMGNKVGGAFSALIAAAVKFGLVSNTKGKLKTEPLYQDYKLAYSELEKQAALRRAFLSAPLFAAIAKRFEGQVLPAHFEKLLIREHHVSEDFASRIVGYFTEGAKESGIIAPDGTVNSNPQNITGEGALVAGAEDLIGPINTPPELKPPTDTSTAFIRGYTVRVTGPGIDSTIAIKDEEDLEIVEVTLKKVRKLLKVQDLL